MASHSAHPSRLPAAPGGGDGRFLTTRWTVIMEAGQSGDEARQAAAMEQFARAYWYPVYAYIRRKGHDHASAEDLQQEFFAQLLTKNWLSRVQRRETRFSTLLLAVLGNFLVSYFRHGSRAKRGGGQAPESLDRLSAEQWYADEPRTNESPERLFERRLAHAVLASALEHMRTGQHSEGRGAHFDALAPFLSREAAAGEYEAAAKSLGITTVAVTSAVSRLRREYRRHVREEVAAGLTDKSRVDEELRHLAQAMEGG